MRLRRIDDVFMIKAETPAELKRIEEFVGVVPPPPEPPKVDAADILARASANVPFAQQSGYNTQIINRYIKAADIPEGGVHGPSLPALGTLRFGKVPDPGDQNRKAFCFVLAPTDPNTSGSKRAELKFAENVAMGQVYWAAFGLYVYDWGSVPDSDVAVLGMQLHSGGSSGLSPAVQINARRGRTLTIDARHSLTNPPKQSTSKSVRSPDIPLTFGKWLDFVLRIRLAVPDGGFVQAWIDGAQVFDYAGPVGYNTPDTKPYFKFGYYNWSGLSSTRQLLIREPCVVLDPTGSKYSHEMLRSLICS